MFENSCDSHLHIFGPYERFPLSRDRVYTPPESSVQDYKNLQKRLGFRRSVIVQPSIYGTNNECTLNAIGLLGGPESARAIAVVDKACEEAELSRLAAAGVRGARVNAHHGGGPALTALRDLASRIARLNWHLELYLKHEMLVSHLSLLREMPVTIVIDHLGDINPGNGLNDPSFLALLELLEDGNAWVKVSGYLSSRRPAPYQDIAPFVRRLAEARPDRLVWGTNWPHPVQTAYPVADEALLEALGHWLPDGGLLHRVLVENPAELYGFE